MHFADALTERIRQTSVVCVGLDPAIAKLPLGIEKDVGGLRMFCVGIIEAMEGVASCIKLQLAFFEVHRAEGIALFWEMASLANARGFVVIADGKRGDIGSTCEAYADAYLGGGSPIDALTVNPYLGSDGIAPFITRCAKNDKGIFILVKTSNPSSGELQDLPFGDATVHEHLAELVEGWGESYRGPAAHLSCIGAVVGATYPEELTYLRSLMPHAPLLIPGYGAQGGTAKDVRGGFLPGRRGAIVAASRSIIYASDGADWKAAARSAAQTMAAELSCLP